MIDNDTVWVAPGGWKHGHSMYDDVTYCISWCDIRIDEAAHTLFLSYAHTILIIWHTVNTVDTYTHTHTHTHTYKPHTHTQLTRNDGAHAQNAHHAYGTHGERRHSRILHRLLCKRDDHGDKDAEINPAPYGSETGGTGVSASVKRGLCAWKEAY